MTEGSVVGLGGKAVGTRLAIFRHQQGKQEKVEVSMAKIKFNGSRSSLTGLTTLAQKVYGAMNGNAAFNSLSDQVAAVNGKLTALNGKHNEYQATVQTKLQLRTERESLRVALLTSLNALAAGVEGATLGDTAQIQSAGFDVRGPKSPVGLVIAPPNLVADMGSLEGTVNTRWNAVTGANSYVVECAQNPDGPWNQVAITTRAEYTAQGLTSGTKYWFRVRAVGAAGLGPWSDPAVKMAA